MSFPKKGKSFPKKGKPFPKRDGDAGSNFNLDDRAFAMKISLALKRAVLRRSHTCMTCTRTASIRWRRANVWPRPRAWPSYGRSTTAST